MIKHGSSHAGAVLVCMVAGTVLTDMVKQSVYQWQLTRDLMFLLWRKSANWPVDPDILLRLLLIGSLGFVWGVAFKLAHQGRKAPQSSAFWS